MSYFFFLERPTFTKKPPSRVVLLPGSSSNLCCEAKGSPPPRIEWSRAQQSSDLLPVFQENGCLEVNTAKENSDEDYICRATNRFGLAETTASVITVPLIGWVYSKFNHKNYNFLACDWFKNVLFSSNSLAKLLLDSLLSDILISQ